MLRPAAALLVASVLVAGCSGSQEPDAEALPPASSGTAGSPSGTTATTSSTPGATATDTGAAEAGIDPADPPEPVASATVPAPVPEDPEAKLEVEIYALRRQGKLAIMTAAVTPQNSLSGPQALFTLLGSSFWSPTLIDAVNLKQYSVVSGNGQLSSSEVRSRAASGQRMFLYAAFAAPPPDVTTINVQFFSTAPVLPDVPVR